MRVILAQNMQVIPAQNIPFNFFEWHTKNATKLQLESKSAGQPGSRYVIVLVGRGFALRKWLATLLLASRPMWRGHPYMYPVVCSSTASSRRRSSGAD
jgi:hypothetical protein